MPQPSRANMIWSPWASGSLTGNMAVMHYALIGVYKVFHQRRPSRGSATLCDKPDKLRVMRDRVIADTECATNRVSLVRIAAVA